ncbi:hypothetical protein DPEC_G00202030 [Dallia pectoralis]|uniref:Uncharacterized protein n=1 Tax=Dallia pectoralis TaxID=75939 RepID=A0ACC2G960_DALPE|nr:hypothetical protein DPEC_G00202030 [Dallia pectoralis]
MSRPGLSGRPRREHRPTEALSSQGRGVQPTGLLTRLDLVCKFPGPPSHRRPTLQWPRSVGSVWAGSAVGALWSSAEPQWHRGALQDRLIGATPGEERGRKGERSLPNRGREEKQRDCHYFNAGAWLFISLLHNQTSSVCGRSVILTPQ